MLRIDRRIVIGAALSLAVIGGFGTTACAVDGDPAAPAGVDRQEAVAERGEDVMGFDLDATVHRFTPTDTGGIEEVVVRDPLDQAEIADVRAHLRTEAERWSLGDFSAPAAIHGEDMPGLQELQAAGDVLTIDYTDLPDGARVTFMSTDPDVVVALREWFDAQLSDHAQDAEHG